MSQVKIAVLDSWIQAYLKTLEDRARVEHFGSQREMAEEQLIDFLGYMKRERAFNEAVEIVEAAGYEIVKRI